MIGASECTSFLAGLVLTTLIGTFNVFPRTVHDKVQLFGVDDTVKLEW